MSRPTDDPERCVASGGPNFVGSSTVIAGVNSFVYNSQCAGFSGVYRIDKADDVNWLATFFD